MQNNVNEISDDFSREPEEYQVELFGSNEPYIPTDCLAVIVGLSFGILIAIAFS